MSDRTTTGRTRLVLLRHGQTDWNVAGRYQGQTDIPLNAVGIEQARMAAPLVAALRPTAIFSSPLSRALDTVTPIADRLGLPVDTDDRLREIHVGSWSGLTTAQMHDVDPGFERAFRAGRDYRRSPEGETADEVGVRMREVLTDIAAAHEGHAVLVATHGLALRMGTGYLLGWDFDQTWRLGPMDNCGWTILGRRDDGWHLESYNRCALQALLPGEVQGEGA